MSIKDITVIITSFKSGEKIKNCLNSIDRECKVLLIENSNDPNIKENIEKEFSNVECILTGANLGYGKSNNIGLKKVTTKYALILNPDTYLWEDSISKMVRFMDGHPDIGVLGPDLKDIHGRSQLPASRFPGLMQQLLEALFLNFVNQKNESAFN